MKLRWNLIYKLAISIILTPIIALVLLPLPKNIQKEYSVVIKFKNGDVMRIYKTTDDSFRIYTSIDEIDPKLINAALCYEDKYFYYHLGINPFSIIRALYQNLKARKTISGGSTITMQLVKIINPRPRTISSKLLEAITALHYELHLSKKQILQYYFNYAPYGGNLYGVAAAAYSYFGKSPKNLYYDEIAYLLALPQSPSKRKAGSKYAAETIRKRNKILYKLLQCELISEKEYFQAINAPIPKTTSPMPFDAPHAADFIKAYYASNNKNTQVYHSTIDENIQKTTASIVSNYKYLLEQNGASQAAAVVIDNTTREVVALVGSLDYWDNINNGQVIGFWAYRSPGSTLKPFLYAKAIEEGLITTEMLIEDVPVDFNGFRPLNFYKNWDGLVSAETALSQSLNVPFIHILKKYGVKKFLNLLDDAEISYNKNITYGLSLITGSIEIKLLELTNLYATLARNGLHGKFIILKGEKLNEFPLIKQGAVILTKKALSIRNRPDAPNLNEFINFPKKIYWKTGTSFGRKDAWSIGWIDNYTVGIWVGNFNGESSPNIVGAKLAAPIMFDILQSLLRYPKKPKIYLPLQSPDLVKIKVCSFSGYKPSPHCPSIKIIQALESATPPEECPYHKKYIIEKNTGYLACPYKKYLPGELEEKAFLLIPSIIAFYMNKVVENIPTLSPDCQLLYSSNKLRILSPTNNSTYIIYDNIFPKNKISLQAFTSSQHKLISWFANGEYIGKAPSGNVIIFEPTKDGKISLFAIDEDGNVATTSITVIKGESIALHQNDKKSVY